MTMYLMNYTWGQGQAKRKYCVLIMSTCRYKSQTSCDLAILPHRNRHPGDLGQQTSPCGLGREGLMPGKPCKILYICYNCWNFEGLVWVSDPLWLGDQKVLWTPFPDIEGGFLLGHLEWTESDLTEGTQICEMGMERLEYPSLSVLRTHLWVMISWALKN